jgi:hypothetical protein
MRSSRQVIGTAVLCAIGLVLLAGCTPETTHPTQTSTSSTVKPTASAAAEVVPACDELLSGQDASALLGTDVAVSHGDALDSVVQPIAYRLAAAAGTSCTWAAQAGAAGTQLSVELLPGAGAAWDTVATWYPATSEQGANYGTYQSRGGDCEATPATADCHTNVLVAQNWLSVTASSAAPTALTEARFHQTVQQIVPVAAKAAAKSSIPGRLGKTVCASPDYATAAARAYGSPVASLSPPENIFRVEAALLLVPGAELCPFQPSTDGSGGIMVTLEATPNARKQFDAYRALLTAAGTASTPVSVAGSPEPGIGRTIPFAGSPQYALDVLKGDDWLRFTSDDIDSASAHARAFATWVLAQ